MAKRLTDKQKEEITKSFIKGKTVDDLSKIFNCANLTISRNLKKKLGEQKYKEIVNKNNTKKESSKIEEIMLKDNKEINSNEEISLESSLIKGILLIYLIKMKFYPIHFLKYLLIVK